jgi:hypothetical protein
MLFWSFLALWAILCKRPSDLSIEDMRGIPQIRKFGKTARQPWDMVRTPWTWTIPLWVSLAALRRQTRLIRYGSKHGTVRWNCIIFSLFFFLIQITIIISLSASGCVAAWDAVYLDASYSIYGSRHGKVKLYIMYHLTLLYCYLFKLRYSFIFVT